MVTLLAFIAILLVIFRLVIDLFPILEKDVFKESEDLISFDEVEELTINLWDKLVDQATAEAKHNTDLKCWTATFKEMREGDIQLFSFLKKRLSERELRHLMGILNYSGVYSLARDVYREEKTHLDVEGLMNITVVISNCIDNFGFAKRQMLAGARSFCATKVDVLGNFGLAFEEK